MDDPPKIVEVAAGHAATQVQAAAHGMLPVPDVVEDPDRRSQFLDADARLAP